MGKEGDVAAGSDSNDGLPPEQLVFFVRHAESRWNRAQAEYGLVSMMCENDHGLSDDGRAQAEALRARLRTAFPPRQVKQLPPNAPADLWLGPLLKPDIVYSSPFTRTLSTAVIGLKDILPGNNELVLMREAREQKNIGGADSTGVATGDEIAGRLESEIRSLYGGTCTPEQIEAAVQSLAEVQLDTSSVKDEWWGPLTGDAEEDLLNRIQAFVERLRRTRGEAAGGGGGAAVVVGHSLFFRTLFNTFLANADGRGRPIGAPDVDASLRLRVLPFCGVVGTRIRWDAHGWARIVEAVPLLGTELAPASGVGVSNPLVSSCVCRQGKNDSCSIA